MKARDKESAAIGWDASPVSTARLAAEMWNVIKNEKWALPVSDRIPWARRLWPVTEHYQMLGGTGAAGVGRLRADRAGRRAREQGQGHPHGRVPARRRPHVRARACCGRPRTTRFRS